MADLLIELCSEEIPARMQNMAAQHFGQIADFGQPRLCDPVWPRKNVSMIRPSGRP